MRTIFVIGLVLICAFMAGWFTINREGGETTIKLNGEEFRNDTRKVITKGHDILHKHADQLRQEPQQQLQPGQSVPASWAQQQQQQYPNQQYQQPGQQYQQQQAQYPNQQYPNQQYQQQQQYQAQQPMQQQQPQGGFYYPDNQQAKRPPAPWQGQLNAPAQTPQPGQF